MKPYYKAFSQGRTSPAMAFLRLEALLRKRALLSLAFWEAPGRVSTYSAKWLCMAVCGCFTNA